MDTRKKKLFDLLVDAHVMESRAVAVLEEKQARIPRHPEVVAKIKRHIRDTEWQLAQLQSALYHLGATPQEVLASGAGGLADVGLRLLSDELMRDSVANSAFERFEMAVYATIAAVADDVGEREIARQCRAIMRQEEEMALWLEKHLLGTSLGVLMSDDVRWPAYIT